MAESERVCSLCGNASQELFFQGELKGYPVKYVLCRNCGMVYQSPAPSQEELDRYYESEYRLQYQGSEDPTEKDLRVQRGRAESLVSFTAARTGKLSAHLDIGSSAGVLLQAFHEAFGTRPVGIEPGRAYREYARRQGLVVYASLDELKASETGPFDLISLAHVLEHLPDPAAYLAELRNGLLGPGGFLLIETPNLYAHDSFEPAHLSAFSPHTLAETVRKAGYDILVLEKHGRPRSRRIPLYLTLLAVPHHAGGGFTVQPERRVALKRKLGFLRRRLLEKIMLPGTWMN